MRPIHLYCSAVIALVSWAAPVALAAVPTTSAIEGVLLSSGGGPAADGNYTVAISIYGAETGGSAVWTESGVAIAAKAGQFSYQIGSKTPLSAAALSLPKAWVGIQIGTDPELPRKPLGSSPYALRAAIAEGLECTGCLKAGNLDAGVLQPYAKAADLGAYAKTADLSAYAKTSDLGPYAKTSDLSSYAKAADLADYVKATSLAKVAGTGSYNDLKNLPTLAKVATSGSYADLTNTPVEAKVGAACGTDLVMKGIKADGSYECVAAGIAADMINEVSNDLIWNQFVDKTDGTKDVQIKDGFSAGVTDTLNFPDIGLAQKIWVEFSAGNSDISKLTVELFAPGMSTPYILYKGSKTGTTLTAKYNDTDKLDTGDMNKDWLNKNIKGNWSITVKDTLAISVPPGTPPFVYDGKFNWSVNIQTLSSKKIQIKGNLLVDGTVSAAAGLKAGPVAKATHSLAENGDAWHKGELVRAIARKVGYQSDSRESGELDGRVLSFTKRNADTSIRVVWHDNIRNTTTGWCRYEATVAVNSTGAAKACTAPGPMWSGLYTNGQNLHLPMTHTWFCDKIDGGLLPAGTHSLRIRVDGQGSTDCHTGWPDQQYSMSIEEIY